MVVHMENRIVGRGEVADQGGGGGERGSARARGRRRTLGHNVVACRECYGLGLSPHECVVLQPPPPPSPPPPPPVPHSANAHMPSSRMHIWYTPGLPAPVLGTPGWGCPLCGGTARGRARRSGSVARGASGSAGAHTRGTGGRRTGEAHGVVAGGTWACVCVC